MAKIGSFMTVPTGAYCYLTLDSGERVLVTHQHGDAGGAGACLTVDRLKLLGFSSERVFRLDLNSTGGDAAVATLSAASPSGSSLRCLVTYLGDCRSLDELLERCRQLMPMAGGAA